MSGQQIGTAVGFVAGFFLPGGPQVWAAIGGFIGGVIDPTEIKGPHIGDGSQQSSNEGNPIAWILGTAGWIQGNLVQVSARREVKKEDDGKGGPVVVTYEAHQDYCIMPAESSETRQSTIVGVLMVRVNGKIVYDMRPGSNLGAENAKFLQHHTFHYGAEDQMPDPTMEAISGVGNTPAYRGVFTMVARDVNITEYGDAIPTYEFVLVGNGELVVETEEFYEQPRLAEFINANFPLGDPPNNYGYILFWNDADGSGLTSPEFDSIDECMDWFNDQTGLTADIYVGYSATTFGTAGGASTGEDGGGNKVSISQVETQSDVTDIYSVTLMYQFEEPGAWHNVSPGAMCAVSSTSDWSGAWNGSIMRKMSDPTGYLSFENCGDGFINAGYYPVCIQVLRRPYQAAIEPGDPCLTGGYAPVPDAPGYMVDCERNVVPQVEYGPAPPGYRVLANAELEIIDDSFFYVYQAQGPAAGPEDQNFDDEDFWTDAYDAAVLAGSLPSGWVYGVDYPVLGNQGLLGTVTTSSLTSNALSVATAIERISLRGGLAIEDLDTADIDAMLQGYPIQADYNAADDIKPLLAYCSAFASEYDGQIHFHPYGEAIEIIIDPEDFVEGSDVTDDGSREQAKEYPRKLSVNSIDITQNYTVRPQYAYRNTPDVRAIGEETIQIPLCDTPDHTAKIAEIAIKVSYARMQGTRKFTVPYVGADTYLKLVPGMPFALDGKRWVANRIMLEDGVMAIEAAYDRQSAYTSNATGVPALPPTPPDSTIGGVTQFAVMNLPVLRDQDDKLVLYFAVAGLLPGWQGCLLQWSVDDGASWQTAIASMTQSSVIGFLTAPLALAPAEGDDITNTLSVSVRGGELNSITYLQYLNEGNPCAILKTSLQAEVLQFLDADETDPNEYDLTTLARGRLGTTPAAHPQGARFCGLDSVYVMEIPSAYRGRELLFRPVTFGTAPENNAVYAILFDPPVSQTELPPQDISYDIVGTEMFLHVYPRHRLGTSAQPVASSNMLGYSWHVTDGVNVANRDTASQDTVISIAGWSFPITVQVSQVNRFTGAGPALEVII